MRPSPAGPHPMTLHAAGLSSGAAPAYAPPDDDARARAPVSHASAAPARAWRWVPPALLALHAVLAWLSRAPGMLTGQDDAYYLTLARALRHGQYRDLAWPGTPPHHMYPPGYPALLALWTTIGGERFDWLVALQIALSVTALGAAYLAARRALPHAVALCGLLVLAVNPPLVLWAGQVTSEGALAACIAVAVWGATCLPRGNRQVAVVLAAALAAPMMRTAGIVVPLAVVLLWLIERRFRDAAVAAALSLLVVAPLLWWTMSDPQPMAGASYAADAVVTTNRAGAPAAARTPFTLVLELLRRARTNAVYYPSRGLPTLLPVPTIPGTVIDNVLTSLLILAGLAVGAVRARGGFRLAALVLLASAGLLLVWPYQLWRYLMPVLPVLVPVLLAGIAAIGGWFGRRAGLAALGVATLAIAANGAVHSAGALGRARRCEQGQPMPPATCMEVDQANFFRAARFIRDSLPAGARVLTAKSVTLYVYTGHPAAPLERVMDADSAAFWDRVRGTGAEYVMLGALLGGERPLLAPKLRARCADLALVREYPPRTLLFRVPGATGAGGDGRACDALARFFAAPDPLVQP